MNEKWKKKLANAANNDDYVKLNTGLMRVSDLNNYLSSFPSNLLAFNKLGKFTYYKQLPGMNYNPPELGENIISLGKTEQEKKQLEEVFHKLSTGREKNSALRTRLILKRGLWWIVIVLFLIKIINFQELMRVFKIFIHLWNII